MVNKPVVKYIPKRNNKKWSTTDLIKLENMIEKDYDIITIANNLQRTSVSIYYKVLNEFNICVHCKSNKFDNSKNNFTSVASIWLKKQK